MSVDIGYFDIVVDKFGLYKKHYKVLSCDSNDVHKYKDYNDFEVLQTENNFIEYLDYLGLKFNLERDKLKFTGDINNIIKMLDYCNLKNANIKKAGENYYTYFTPSIEERKILLNKW